MITCKECGKANVDADLALKMSELDLKEERILAKKYLSNSIRNYDMAVECYNKLHTISLQINKFKKEIMEILEND